MFHYDADQGFSTKVDTIPIYDTNDQILSFFLTILSFNDNDDQNIRIVKLDSNLEVEWTEEYGECDGSDQLFDFVVDRLVAKKYKQRG